MRRQPARHLIDAIVVIVILVAAAFYARAHLPGTGAPQPPSTATAVPQAVLLLERLCRAAAAPTGTPTARGVRDLSGALARGIEARYCTLGRTRGPAVLATTLAETARILNAGIRALGTAMATANPYTPVDRPTPTPLSEYH